MKTKLIASIIPACCIALAIPAMAEDTKHHDSDFHGKPYETRSESKNQEKNESKNYSNDSYEHALTPAKFVHKALKCGKKDVALARLATDRAQDAEVKTLAANIVSAHERANERLMTISREKGYSSNDTNAVSRSYERPARSERSENTVSRGLADTVNAAGFAQNGRGESFFPGGAPLVPTEPENPRRDIAKDHGTKDHDKSRMERDNSHDRLQSLNGAEFDRAFVRQVITDHHEAIALFTRASRDLDDSQLKAFASETLPTLQEHLSEAERLAGRGITANR